MTKDQYIDYIWSQEAVWYKHTVSYYYKSGGFSTELTKDAVLDTIIYFIKSIERFEKNNDIEKLKKFEGFSKQDFNNYFYKSIANKVKEYFKKEYTNQKNTFSDESFDLENIELENDYEDREMYMREKLKQIQDSLYILERDKLITKKDFNTFNKVIDNNNNGTEKELLIYKSVLKLVKKQFKQNK
jgi:hypothetical protein